MFVVVVGLSHRTAPVEIREGVAVLPNALRPTLERIYRLPGVAECALISTCNRSETYLVTDSPDAVCEGVVGVLGELSGLDAGLLRKHLFVHRDGEAVRHLFGVASGLDSMIMGEPQVAGQVKESGAAAMGAGTSRTVLNRLFRSATEASKRARTETEIAVGAVSVSFAAVELAKKIFGSLEGRSALVLGAGEMSELTARHLVENGVRSLTVASRTLERAEALAEQVNGQAMAWQDAMDSLHTGDVVISSTGAGGYILDKKTVVGAMQQRRNRSMFLIDIAIPRDIDPEVGELYNVVLYDIDDLEAVVGSNLKKRQREAKKVREILEEEISDFLSWLNSLEVIPAIVSLRQRFQEVMEVELGGAKLSGFTDEQKALVSDLLRRYMNKLLHGPVTRLKKASDSEDGLAHVASLAQLFGLELEQGKETNRSSGKEKKRLEGVRS